MTWKVRYSEGARTDLSEIFNYISHTLLEPSTAKKQVKRIRKSIDSLDFMPLRFRLYDYEPLRSEGLRIMTVDNYAVLYVPDESTATVTIVRIIYGGRDIPARLREDLED